MKDRLRVYIAGPISKGLIRDNIAQGNQAMVRLMRAGMAPFNPMLSCFTGYPDSGEPEVLPCGTANEDWHGVDMPWVTVSDALLRLPGESRGADAEVAHANALGIPVYDDIDTLIANPPAERRSA